MSMLFQVFGIAIVGIVLVISFGVGTIGIATKFYRLSKNH